MNEHGNQGAEVGREVQRRRFRVRRGLIALAVLAAAGVVGAELVLRVGIGLGDPPVFDLDPEIEYLYRANQRCRYRHHDLMFNAYSMRSGDFGAKKADERELRVLVIGDSIVTGGAKIDQRELATELLRDRLAKATGRPVVVGNVAAGSWGPPNQLAYVKRFGVLDADVVVVVLNSGDADDVPGLEPIGVSWPRSKPFLAIEEPVRLVLERAGVTRPARSAAPPVEERRRMVREALSGLAEASRGAGAGVAAVQFWKRSELARGTPEEGHGLLASALEAAGVEAVQTRGVFEADAGLFQAGDDVHPSAAGHAKLAEVLESAVNRALGARSEKR